MCGFSALLEVDGNVEREEEEATEELEVLECILRAGRYGDELSGVHRTEPILGMILTGIWNGACMALEAILFWRGRLVSEQDGLDV